MRDQLVNQNQVQDIILGENNGVAYQKSVELKVTVKATGEEIDFSELLEYSHSEKHANGEESIWSKLSKDSVTKLLNCCGTIYLHVTTFNWVQGSDPEEDVTVTEVRRSKRMF